MKRGGAADVYFSRPPHCSLLTGGGLLAAGSLSILAVSFRHLSDGGQVLIRAGGRGRGSAGRGHGGKRCSKRLHMVADCRGYDNSRRIAESDCDAGIRNGGNVETELDSLSLVGLQRAQDMVFHSAGQQEDIGIEFNGFRRWDFHAGECGLDGGRADGAECSHKQCVSVPVFPFLRFVAGCFPEDTAQENLNTFIHCLFGLATDSLNRNLFDTGHCFRASGIMVSSFQEL